MNDNLKMVRGDTFSFTMEIEGLTTDLTDAYFSCKKNIDDTTYSFQKSLGAGIEKIDASENSISYQVTIAPTDTEDLEEGNYYYDLQIEVDNDVYTPLLGVLNITADITRVNPASL